MNAGFNIFSRTSAWAIGLLAMLLPIVARGQSVAASQPSSLAAVVSLSGEVDDFTRDQVYRGYSRAKAAGATTVILQLNTYGGLVTSGMDIARFVKRQSDAGIHTVAFVDDKAISAGALIAMACDEIVMSPGAQIGDCAPISVTADPTGNQQLVPLPAAERAKMESPLLSEFDDSASRNGYSPVLAEAMVAVDRVVYCVEKDGGRKFAGSENEYQSLKAAGWHDIDGVPVPLDSSSTLLTMGNVLAAKVGLSKGTFDSPEAVAAAGGKTIAMTFAPTTGDRFIDWLGGSAARVILLAVFLQCLYIIVHAPGHGLAEAVAVLAFGLLLGIPLLNGYGQWWEICMIVAGLALVAFEVFVFPGHLVSAIAGSLLMATGFVLTFVGRVPGEGVFTLPPWGVMSPEIARGIEVMLAGFACAAVGSFFFRRYLPAIPLFNRLILRTSAAGMRAPASAAAATFAGHWPPLHAVGRATTDLRPGGNAAFVEDTTTGTERAVNVVSDSGFVAAGAPVVVREVGGNRVLVRPLA